MRAQRPRLLLSAALATTLLSGLFAAAAATPTPVAAGTAETMETSILTWMNRDRAALGLRPLYRHGKLTDLAGDRAAIMASKNVLSHTAAGSLTSQLSYRSIQWFSYGENIGRTSYAWGSSAAANLYAMWKASPGHWALMTSNKLNYVGIGVAYRSANRTTYAAIVFTESIDQTRPVARMSGSSRSGTTVSWSWDGWDRVLQSHTAGLRDFDIQYRTGYGTWSTVRNDTTSRSLTLTNRRHGTSVALRARSRDWRGLLSNWSPELRVWIP